MLQSTWTFRHIDVTGRFDTTILIVGIILALCVRG